MKLEEFSQLTEIEKISSLNNHGIDFSKVDDVKIINQKYLDDYYIEQGKFKDHLFFFVRLIEGNRIEGHKLVAAIVAQEIDDFQTKNNHKPIMIVRTWCEKEYRNKGVVTNLYRFLYNTLKYALLSDVAQTPETISVWNKVRDFLPTQMVNLDTGEIQDIDDKILYDPSKRFVLIVERLKELPITSPFYKVTQAPNGILEDYRFNTDGL